jgi:hypothetical protein
MWVCRTINWYLPVSFHVTDTKKNRAYIEFLVSKSVILFRRWRKLRPVIDGGDDFTCTRETKGKGKRCIKIGAAEKGEKRHAGDLWRDSTRWVTDMYTYQWRVWTTRVAFIISDAFCREESLIFPCISDASRKNASLSLSVTHLVHPCHQYGHISVTRLGNTRHKFYQWRVSFARVTDMLLLVTRIVPRAWATTN